MNYNQMRAILKAARSDESIDFIQMNTHDLYDFADCYVSPINTLCNRLDLVRQRRLQRKGLHGWLDGYAIYCSLEIPEYGFSLGKEPRYKTNNDVVYNIKDIL